VSLFDQLPTFLDVAIEGNPPEGVAPLGGKSLILLLSGEDAGEDQRVISEYSSEGVSAASRMLREGPHKYVYTRGFAPMRFDSVADPDELNDLDGTPPLAATQAHLHARLIQDWDPEAVHVRILSSQNVPRRSRPQF
jgi:choline-sulfatase